MGKTPGRGYNTPPVRVRPARGVRWGGRMTVLGGRIEGPNSPNRAGARAVRALLRHIGEMSTKVLVLAIVGAGCVGAAAAGGFVAVRMNSADRALADAGAPNAPAAVSIPAPAPDPASAAAPAATPPPPPSASAPAPSVPARTPKM